MGCGEGDRVGVRLSPSGTFNDMADSNPAALFGYVIGALNRFDLAYLHLVEPRWTSDSPETDLAALAASAFRPIYSGTLITAGGFDRDQGNAVIAEGKADLVAYGRLYISNPDLPERFAGDAPLNPYDRSSFYGGDERGYTDYPTLALQTA